MPELDVDLGNIPDIIEAQLTLSYSRLSGLIRLIVDQGNSHDNEIAELKKAVTTLVAENEAMKQELIETRKDNIKNDVLPKLERLQNEVDRLAAVQDAQGTALNTFSEEQRTRLTEIGAALKRELAERETRNQAVDEKIKDADERMDSIENSIGFSRAFADLWGASAEPVYEMARRDPENPNIFEHGVDERADYLNSLPAFQRLYEELSVLRQMMHHQATDALAAKTEAKEIRRVSHKNGENAAANDASWKELIPLMDQRLKALETKRLPPLEERVYGSLDGSTVPDREPTSHRLSMMEERLKRLLNLQGQEGSTAADHPAALVDLETRVQWLEDAIEGSSVGQNQPQQTSGASNALNSALSAQEGHLMMNGSSEIRPAKMERAVLSSEEGHLPLPHSNLQDGVSGNHLGDGNEGKILGNSPTHSGIRNEDRAAGSGASAVMSNRRVSALGESDEGLRIRVGQLQNHVTALQAEKADRIELQALQDALRSINHNYQMLPGQKRGSAGEFFAAANGIDNMMNNYNYQGNGLIPQRPGSQHNNSRFGNQMDERGGDSNMHGGTISEHLSRAGSAGRPLFVGSSSVFLRDCSRGGATAATVSPPPFNSGSTH